MISTSSLITYSPWYFHLPLPFTLPWISQVAPGTNGTLEPCAGVQRKSQEQARSLTTHSSRGRHANLKGVWVPQGSITQRMDFIMGLRSSNELMGWPQIQKLKKYS